MHEAILLTQLKHTNLMEFIGLHQQTIQEFRFTYIVSPWMENGNIVSYIADSARKGNNVPRIQWVSLNTISYPVA